MTTISFRIVTVVFQTSMDVAKTQATECGVVYNVNAVTVTWNTCVRHTDGKHPTLPSQNTPLLLAIVKPLMTPRRS